MPDFRTEIITCFGSITCYDSSFYLNSQPSSAWNEVNGERVPEVRMIDLGPKFVIDFIPNAALKHKNSIFLLVYAFCLPLATLFIKGNF